MSFFCAGTPSQQATDRLVTDLGLPETKYGTEIYQAYYGTNLSYYASAAFPVNIFIKGKPIGLFWGYKTNGIFQSDEEAGELVYNGNKLGAGDIAYIDTNEDGTINTEDRVILGDPNPDFTYGFNTSLTYREFTLSAQFHGSYGNKVVNANKLDNTNTHYDYNLLKEAYYEAWRPEKPSNTYPKLDTPLSERASTQVENHQRSTAHTHWPQPVYYYQLYWLQPRYQQFLE